MQDYFTRSARSSARMEGGDLATNSVDLMRDYAGEELKTYRDANPKAGFLCTYDRSWKNPKCCLNIWPYEQGLKILMIFMILEFPGTIMESI